MTFDLGAAEDFSRAGFFASPANAEAQAVLADWAHWPQNRLLLTGPEGAGKTHLAHIWAQEAGATLLMAAALPGLDPTSLPPRLVVEEADAVAGRPAHEEALFHLLNHQAHSGGHLLLTARRAPRDWGLGLPDLLSRLQSLAIARLDAPDDALLSAVLVKLFADRQIAVAPNLIPYLAARMDRSIAAARALVAALDARALALGRPVTRALAAELLDSTGNG
ncbi:P-loop NTPase family protein [Tabrizicola oligotrophica]|uniref:Chromosomal replication initiator DnaA n=1 Tax=Tabrizicola oligotrophica TaxID=2710650 RepID=A0A6M0QYB5_9RHOB|nr:DnaA/Hda family protein [Tabrizicola oligotrophica]NEY91442.1 chromosomal replication initiator DnaA [Tabrizicola oligotrophica]